MAPFLPANRDAAHINVVEFLTEILCAVVWSVNPPILVMCEITDNTSSDMRYTNGKARRGDGLRLARTFHRWLLSRVFRLYSCYWRSGRNLTAYFLPRADLPELGGCAIRKDMVRNRPLQRRFAFC